MSSFQARRHEERQRRTGPLPVLPGAAHRVAQICLFLCRLQRVSHYSSSSSKTSRCDISPHWSHFHPAFLGQISKWSSEQRYERDGVRRTGTDDSAFHIHRTLSGTGTFGALTVQCSCIARNGYILCIFLLLDSIYMYLFFFQIIHA